MSEKGVEKGGILDVFSLFQSAFPAEKARCSAADDLFRVSLGKTRSTPGIPLRKLVCFCRYSDALRIDKNMPLKYNIHIINI